jgi:cytochrome c556
MKKRLLLAGFALALGAGYTLTAFSQVKPEILVKQRQAAMTLQGKYFGPMAGMAQGKIPYNADVVARNAAYLDVLNKMPWDGFAESTKDLKDVKTAALPAIWNEPAKFKEAQEKFQSAVSRLVAATKTGDEASIKSAIVEVGKGGCGNCHQNFRQKD